MPAENRARVLRAASRSFLRHGYHTSVDEIARRAGVAKQTLYHHFPSKDQLFKEVACDLAKHLLVGLEAEPADVRNGLLRFGLAYRRRVLCAEGLAMFRTLTAEVPRFKALAKAIYAGGAGEMLRRLSAYLRKAMNAGALRRDDPEFAAELFLSMLAGHERVRRLFLIVRAPLEIELQQARASLAQERARQEQAQQDLERLKGLADRRAISQRETDQAATGLKQAVAAAQLAEARVRQSELNLSYASVNAPIAGITGRAQQSIGSLVTPGTDSSLLTTLTQADPIWVRFALSETEYARLRGFDIRNPEVKVELPDGSGYPEPGRLNFSSSSVDSNLGTVQMRAELPNPRLQLLPGQYVRVQVVAGSQQALVVPQSAVMQNEGGRFVWIVGAEGKAAQRQIKVGSWVGDDWVVLEGLKAGDTVIVDNLLRLRAGTPVKLQAKG